MSSNGIDLDFYNGLERACKMTPKQRLETFLADRAIQDFPELVQALATLEVAEAIKELRVSIKTLLTDAKWDKKG